MSDLHLRLCRGAMNRARAKFVLLLLLFLPAVLPADTPVSISILSILQPTELTITLREPDRAMLHSDTSQSVIAARDPLRIQLQKDRLQIDSRISTREVSIECANSCLFEVKLRGLDRRQYKGNLKLTAGVSTISIVLLANKEDLLASIVASEMGEYRLRPALQAFAVVARSFLQAGPRHPELGADLCDLTHCQVFQSYAPVPEALNAVRDTTGLVLTFRRKPFRAYYFRSCGGTTATFEEVWGKPSPDYPFSRSKCPCSAPWDTTLNAAEIKKILGMPVRNLHQSETTLGFSTGTGERSFRLEEFRIAAGRAIGWNRIRSNSFAAEQREDVLLIRGKGIGHRVGFCQNGAFQMAQQGKSFQEILQHYFPNTEIRSNN